MTDEIDEVARRPGRPLSTLEVIGRVGIGGGFRSDASAIRFRLIWVA